MGHDSGAGDAGQVRAPGAERAETCLRLMAETELRRAMGYPGHEARPSVPESVPPAAEGVNRVRIAAGALIAIGAIGEGTAHRVLAGLESALAARSMLPRMQYGSIRVVRFGRGTPVAGLPGGPVRLVPVGKSLSLPAPVRDRYRPVSDPPGRGGRQGSEDELLHLLVLVLAPDRAAVTFVGRMQAPDHGPGVHQLLFEPGDVALSDDHGTCYQAQFGGGASADKTWWSGVFCSSAVPPAGTRWLDIALAPGTGPLRVSLTGPASHPHPSPVTSTSAACAAGPFSALPAVGAAQPGERLLDCIAGDLLWSSLRPSGGSQERSGLTGLTEMVAALEAAGPLAPGSPALGRLTAVARRLGIPVPGGLQATVAPAQLPEAWNGVLADRDRSDGRDGVAPVAAVLPEIDGACFAIAGLYSSARSATLLALAWGWRQEHSEFPRADERFSWWARDSTGRWHVGRQTGGSRASSGGHEDLEITLVPPLHPAATSLDITLTGRSAWSTATAPLDWQVRR